VKGPTRRHILRGAGVALALPWLESLAPRRARGQSPPTTLRFVPIYFPLGNRYLLDPDYWTPTTPGQGDAWQLSPILEPFQPVKSQVAVLGNVDQTAWGSATVDPGNGQLTGAYLTCVKESGPSDATNGVSIDQRIAAVTGASSLQLGLSTLDSYCDGSPCVFSRSISFDESGASLGKLVDPQAVFDLIVSGGQPNPAPPDAAARESVLDFVIGNATSLAPRLGASDRALMDQYLTSVRDLETRVAAVAACQPIPRPTLSANVNAVPPDYNRDVHADVMIDLIVMALSCDKARVVSFMLDDARSDFVYDFLPLRHFTAAGSTPATGNVGVSPLVAANGDGGNDQWMTIDWWYASKASTLCQKLGAIPDGPGVSLLDNSIVWFGSGQQGENVATNLPVLYVGGGGGVLRTNSALRFAPSQSLSNVYLTFLRNVFGAADARFADSTGVIPDLLA
jgi:hypothetical protein